MKNDVKCKNCVYGSYYYLSTYFTREWYCTLYKRPKSSVQYICEDNHKNNQLELRFDDRLYNSIQTELEKSPHYKKYYEECQDKIWMPEHRTSDDDSLFDCDEKIAIIINGKIVGYAYFNTHYDQLTIPDWYIQPEYLNETYVKALFNKIATAAIYHKSTCIVCYSPKRDAIRSCFLSLGAEYSDVDMYMGGAYFFYDIFHFDQDAIKRLAGNAVPICKHKEKHRPQATTSLAPLLANIKLD